MLERTLVLIKPDGVRRGIIGQVLTRFENAGLKIIGLKLVHATREFAGRHYTVEDISARHGEPVRQQLLDFITEGPVVAMVLEGASCVDVVRKLVGSTEPKSAPPGTIRGDFCHHGYDHVKEAGKCVRNVIHASATPEQAQTEVALWFTEAELFAYGRNDEAEMY